MFDLNRMIADWRARLGARPDLGPGDLEELEDHLRESCAELQAQGLDPEEAFLIATRRLGDPAELAGEFAGESGSEFTGALPAAPANATAGPSASPSTDTAPQAGRGRWSGRLLLLLLATVLLLEFIPVNFGLFRCFDGGWWLGHGAHCRGWWLGGFPHHLFFPLLPILLVVAVWLLLRRRPRGHR